MVNTLLLLQIVIIGLILIAAGILSVCYIWSDKILLRWYKAREIGFDEPEYLVLVQLAAKAGVEVPKMYLMESPAINSFSIAKKNRNSIVLTTTAIDQFSKEGLEVLMAHELAHIYYNNQPNPFFFVISGALTMLSTAALWGALLTGFGQEDDPAPQLIRSYAMALVGPPAAAILQLTTSKTREFEADDYSAKLCGLPMVLGTLGFFGEQAKHETNPAHAQLFYVNSLDYNLFNVLFNSQPGINERIRRLEEAYFANQ